MFFGWNRTICQATFLVQNLDKNLILKSIHSNKSCNAASFCFRWIHIHSSYSQTYTVIYFTLIDHLIVLFHNQSHNLICLTILVSSHPSTFQPIQHKCGNIELEKFHQDVMFLTPCPSRWWFYSGRSYVRDQFLPSWLAVGYTLWGLVLCPLASMAGTLKGDQLFLVGFH